MLTKRLALVAIILFFASFLSAQHQALHWYTFQSLVPLNAAEGKEALVLIRNQTSDSLSTFNDKNDIFSLACKEEEDLNTLSDLLNDAGFYLIDITNPRIENSYYVRITKGYQYVVLYCADPEKFQTVVTGHVVIRPEVRSMLSSDQKALIDSNTVFIQKEE
jgi:hypothetical protein